MNLFDRLQRHLDEGVVGFPTALASSVGVILEEEFIKNRPARAQAAGAADGAGNHSP